MKRYALLLAISVTLFRFELQIMDAFPIHCGVHIQVARQPLALNDIAAKLLASNKFGSSHLFGAFGPPPDLEEGPKGPDP